MPILKFSVVVIPFIAISLDVLLYAILLKNITQKKLYKKFVLTLITVAFLLNAVWEILHIPLYVGGTYALGHVLFCLLASVADAVMVLLIFLCFAMIYKNVIWVQNLNVSKIIFLVMIGGIGAVLAETRHLSIGTWSYAEAMPLIPIVNVGLSPVLQFMILPLLIYMISFNIVIRNSHK